MRVRPNKEVLALWMGARPGQLFPSLVVALALENEERKMESVSFTLEETWVLGEESAHTLQQNVNNAPPYFE